MQTKHRRGFTLIEMVVVIAIIGVLLALTAPLFSSFLESARKTACMANLTTATRTLEFYEVVENRTLTPDVIDTIMKDSMGADPTSSGYRGICPSGGVYNVTVGASGDIKVRCSKHGMTAVETINSDNKNILDLLQLAIESYFEKRPGNTLNSTGPNFGDDIKERLAASLKISTDFDFRIYKVNNNEYKVYISDPLMVVIVSDLVTVTGYQIKNGWVAGTGTSQLISVGTESVDGVPIKIISAAEYQWD